VSKAPTPDQVVARLKLSLISPSNEISQFFSNRIAQPTSCFSFGRKLGTTSVDLNRSLRLLDASGQPAQYSGLSTDWDDGAVAVNTAHPEKIVSAKLLEHGYVYFNCGQVALFPGHRRG